MFPCTGEQGSTGGSRAMAHLYMQWQRHAGGAEAAPQHLEHILMQMYACRGSI